jgi:excinuclease ABC subunit C
MKPAASSIPELGSQPLILDEPRLKSRLREIPAEPGCYLMRDREDRILYIGKAKALRSRVRSYFQSGAGHGYSPRIRLMVRQVCEIEVIVTDSEAEALALESNLIKQNQPHFNVLLKDDKKYPYLCITWSEAYPRIFITRRRRNRSPLDRFYGPYVDVGLLRRTLALVKRVFPLRQRPLPLHRDRTCLNYDIGRCPGVCQEKISSENYHKTLRQVAMVFQGRNEELLSLLHQQMQAYAERLDFEKAARVRDQLQGLESLTADQKMSIGDSSVSRDVIALASDGRVAAVQLFQMRAGKLVGRLGYMADAQLPGPIQPATSSTSPDGSSQAPAETVSEFNSDAPCTAPSEIQVEITTETRAAADASVGLILQRVIEEHYSQVEGVEIPPELLLQVALPQQDLIGAWLSELRGRRVKLAVPQRSQKAELIELVVRNASYELQRAQRASEQNQMATEDLAQLLELAVPPRRIEGYDISHIQGSDAVASQVVFIDGLPAKQHYRKYRIRSSSIHAGHSDDFMAMAEVIRRRFRRWAQAKAEGGDLDQLRQRGGSALQTDGMGDWPDVVMIDGGKGQLSAVMEALREMNLHDELTVCSLAKQREEVFVPGARVPLESDPDQLGVALLRRLRDEAHRFAVSYHRQQRGERMKRSRLSDIPGLGPKRVKELLAHFRSVEAIQLATPEQIAAAPGVGLALARQVWEYFHPEPEPWEQEPTAALDEDALNPLTTPTEDGVGEAIEAPAGESAADARNAASSAAASAVAAVADAVEPSRPASQQSPAAEAELELAL